MDNALPPSKAPLGTAIGRALDARRECSHRRVSITSRQLLYGLNFPGVPCAQSTRSLWNSLTSVGQGASFWLPRHVLFWPQVLPTQARTQIPSRQIRNVVCRG